MSRFQRPSKEKTRATRVPIDITVESKTIGTEAWCKMTTVDISKSGMLLTWSRKSKMPYIENTIIELTIDPDGRHFKAPVFCLAKVVRKAKPEKSASYRGDLGRELGVQIVQIDNDDYDVWENCLNQLEHMLDGYEIPDRIGGPQAA